MMERIMNGQIRCSTMADDGRIVKQEEDYSAQVDEALPVAFALASV
jgi:hypothetical protein